ncbi:unnamed protein product [Sphagnum tenellum]
MADQTRSGLLERDIEQAITALKKGAQLLKYGRRGKPKFCPFRLSNDETVLIWYSGREEKKLWLNTVTRIVPGQRTAVFQRYPRPEKEYQSFSLIQDNDRSLDVICKDKEEAEVWFFGLEALISGSQMWKSRSDGKIERISDASSPIASTQKSSPLTSPFGSSDRLHQDNGDAPKTLSFFGSPRRRRIEKGFFVGSKLSTEMKSNFFDAGSVGGSMHSGSSDIGSDSVTAHTRLGGGSQADNSRISMSSAVSSSSHGSGHEEGDALGDIFMWGEGLGDGILGGGEHRVGISADVKLDALLPKALQSTVVLDVQNIACGGRHAALVTKHGEVFSWGEESGGRLGHGVDHDVAHPQLVDALAATNTEFVSCGLYHSCAVTLSGDLYTWGDGTHNSGLLGHGNNISHWMPKLVNGPLEGIRVSSVACGHWHTALVTSAGQLFTFGDGTFGALGHGDRKNVYAPREVESLKGLKTVRAACGVWHTAAVVEVMVGYLNASTGTCGKLFTWGDGDKGRLGHGDKEQRLLPTCVAAVVDHNFRQVACGFSLTVALTTAGQVFTMGSTTYGQLGDPDADGKLPGLVEGKLWEAYVEEIACGAHHVAVLTHRTEVYTWGKGANGRLGHGDREDRNTPTLVEALKDKQVKSIACGASFTAAICLHKWLSGADQTMCSGCRQPFGFTRKRHNCYNCGVVFCHACSSKKALKASMAPNPDKPYRVCDPCLIKLKKVSESGVVLPGPLSRRGALSRRSMEVREGLAQAELKVPRAQPPPPKPATIFEAVKQIDRKPVPKHIKKPESFSSRVAPVPTGFPPLPTWGCVDVPASFNFGYPATNASTPKLSMASSNSAPSPMAVSRAVSPLSRRSSPSRATAPTPNLSGVTVSKTVIEDLKKTNDTLGAENMSLRSKVESLSGQLLNQEQELQRFSQQLQNAIAMATEEAVKSRAAKEVIKSLTAQLKEWADRYPISSSRHGRTASMFVGHLDVPNGSHLMATTDLMPSPDGEGPQSVPRKYNVSSVTNNLHVSDANANTKEGERNGLEPAQPNDEGGRTVGSSFSSDNGREPETEWVEQDEPGVYITLTTLPGGGRDLKRVRFSRKRFSEREAEQWWVENRVRVHEQYNVLGGIDRVNNTTVPSSAAGMPGGSRSREEGRPLSLPSYIPVTY